VSLPIKFTSPVPSWHHHVVSRRLMSMIREPILGQARRHAGLTQFPARARVISGSSTLRAGTSKTATYLVILSRLTDPVSNAWRQRASMPTARANCAAAVLDGKRYILGGYDGAKEVADIESYDPATDIWKSEPPMPDTSSCCGAAVIDGAMLPGGRKDRSSKSRRRDGGHPLARWPLECQTN